MEMLNSFEQLASNVHYGDMSEDQISLMSNSSDSINKSMSSEYLANNTDIFQL